MMSTLLLITADPSKPLAKYALRYSQAYLDTEDDVNLKVFFYGDAARLANRLNWNVTDQPNLTTEWQKLNQKYAIPLSVCVSTALVRGVSDTGNATRHQLNGANLAVGFDLVGLSVLADMIQNCDNVIQF